MTDKPRPVKPLSTPPPPPTPDTGEDRTEITEWYTAATFFCHKCKTRDFLWLQWRSGGTEAPHHWCAADEKKEGVKSNI